MMHEHITFGNEISNYIPQEFSNLNSSSIIIGSQYLVSLYNIPKKIEWRMWFFSGILFSNDFLPLTCGKCVSPHTYQYHNENFKFNR